MDAGHKQSDARRVHLSVVIPSYNRGPAILETITRVLQSEARGLESVEVLVVDDGSSTSVDEWLRGLRPRPPYSLTVLHQRNAGPARARNLGFAASRGDIVLFLDDDVLVPPGLLLDHVRAHDLFPGSVICGRCPWQPPSRVGALFRLLGRLGHDAGEGRLEDFFPITVVSSGQISVERASFAAENVVYRNDLVTPAAEEFELSMRLQRRGVRALFARQISALHDSPVSLSALCRQQYKHGVGCAEAVRLTDAASELDELARVLEASRFNHRDSLAVRLRKTIRLPLTLGAPRGLLLSLARAIDGVAFDSDFFSPLYRFVIGLHFTAGVRDGLVRFAPIADTKAMERD